MHVVLQFILALAIFSLWATVVSVLFSAIFGYEQPRLTIFVQSLTLSLAYLTDDLPRRALLVCVWFTVFLVELGMARFEKASARRFLNTYEVSLMLPFAVFIAWCIFCFGDTDDSTKLATFVVFGWMGLRLVVSAGRKLSQFGVM